MSDIDLHQINRGQFNQEVKKMIEEAVAPLKREIATLKNDIVLLKRTAGMDRRQV